MIFDKKSPIEDIKPLLQDLEPGIYVCCLTCKFTAEVKNVTEREIPELIPLYHHSEKMRRVQIKDHTLSKD